MEKVEDQLEELRDTKEEDSAELAHKLEAKRHEHEKELNEEFEKRREATTAKKATGDGPQAAAAAAPEHSTKHAKAGDVNPIECLPSSQAKVSAKPPKEEVEELGAEIKPRSDMERLTPSKETPEAAAALQPHEAVAAATPEQVQRDILEAEEEARRAEVEEATALSSQIEQEVVAAVAEVEAREAAAHAAPETAHATPVIKHVVVAPLPPVVEAPPTQQDAADHQGEMPSAADEKMNPAEAAREEEEEKEEQRKEKQQQQQEEEEEQEQQQEEEEEQEQQQGEEEEEQLKGQEEEGEQSGAAAGESKADELDEVEDDEETEAERRARADRHFAEAERAERTVGGTPQGRRPQVG
ncbi:hypothetical protein ACSSS7_007524 [Eimeria intestinalis]